MTLRITKRPPEGHWTPDQWHAIHTRGAHLLVAAAAGAGKTAVLVERIIQRILDPDQPCDVDRLLVVTFTDAAAAQMRERIGKALSRAAEDPKRPLAERNRLRRQVALLDRASIQTLHGFCLWLLRRYFYLLDIDPLFRVLDGEEATLLKFETVDRLLEQEYDRAAGGDAFYQLIDAFRDARGDGTIRSTLLDLHAYAASLPDPEAWFGQVEAMYTFDAQAAIDDLPWTPVVRSAINDQLRYAYEMVAQALATAQSFNAPEKVQKILREEAAMTRELTDVASEGSWVELYQRLVPGPTYKTMRFDGFDDDLIKARIRNAREEAKTAVRSVRDTYFRHVPEVELRLLRETAPHVSEIIRLVRRFDTLYRQAKRARAAVDFSDLERLALQVLQIESNDPDVSTPCDELKPHFAEVLVDEYQDINPLQDAILRRVSRSYDSDDPNLFMVGDVKQSIYRFRLADPSLFMHRMRSFAPFNQVTQDDRSFSGPGVVIDLKANFRSRTQVIDGVNFLFRQILTPGVGEMAYDKRAELVAQASYPLQEIPIELHVVEGETDRVPAGGEDEDEGREESAADDDLLAHHSAVETEALLIANLIDEMVKRGDLVYDRENDTMRPIRLSDITILLRSTKGRANVYVEALRSRGIPAYAELGTGFFWAVEVETILSVLRIIDNPRQDIPLAAVLRAPWVDLSTSDLARVRMLDPQGELYDAVLLAAERLENSLGDRIRAFVDQLEAWRTAARRSTLGELIQRIYKETGYPEYVQGMPGGAQRLVNLNALHERAQRFDGFTQGGLGRFLRFVDSLQEEEGDLGEAPVLGEGDDVVRIMSIHKSKGLQFPVVIVANLGKAHNLSDGGGMILYHGQLGIAPKWTDPALGLRTKTLAHLAVSELRRRDAIAEELRVLYVALTRAEERLILVGAVKDLWQTAAKWSRVADTRGWALPDHLLARAKSPLDWVGQAVLRHADGEPLRNAAERELGEPCAIRDHDVLSDPSRWSVRLWRREDVAAVAAPDEVIKEDVPVDLSRLAFGEPLGRSVGSDLAERLESTLGHSYPYAWSTTAPAKVSVTLLAREMFDSVSDEGTALPRTLAKAGDVEPFTSRLRRPLFFEEEHPPTAAEKGTAMHTLLYHLDLTSQPSVDRLHSLGQSLVARHLMTRAQLRGLDLDAVVRFFSTPLGQRVQHAAIEGRLWREWAFTVAVESHRLAGLALRQAGPEPAPGDHLVLQGTIDALWIEGEQLHLLDYKTDNVKESTQLLERYTAQLRLYAMAVHRITGIRPSSAHLVHLAPHGTAVEVEL